MTAYLMPDGTAVTPVVVGNATGTTWTPGSAQTQPYAYTPVAGSQFGLTCASATSLVIPSGALQCVVEVEGASVRYTYDGVTTPTATVGMLLALGQAIQFSGPLVLANLKFIQVTSAATLNVSYTK